jgi:two-component system phosphate regulon sensor histidine kinase PhoR
MLKSAAGWVLARKYSIVAALAGGIVLVASGTPAWLALAVLLVAIVPAPKAAKPSPPVVSASEGASEGERDTLVEVRAAFAGFDSPAYLLDGKANVIYQNPSARDAFGDVEIGQHVSARMRVPVILDMIRDAMAAGRNGQAEYSALLPVETAYQVRLIPARDAVGAVGFYVLIFRDISESRRIDRMRTDFVANASHELRTPLSSLRGFIETLLGPARTDAAVQERFLRIMLEQVTRMSRLVDDLMSLSRLELKAKVAPEDRVDLVPLIGSVCDALAPLAGELGVEIIRLLPDQPVIVGGDRDELTQVFENLVENACKYGQEGKRVEVRLCDDPAQPLDVSVIDFGPGIPEDQVPRLTERFYRVNVESSRSKKGTGLGLAIVKHILTRHRARLLIRSEIGKGSTFTVRFDNRTQTVA